MDESPPRTHEARIAELEGALTRRTALMGAVLAASYDGLAVLSPEGVFLEINEAFARFTGIVHDEWIGRRIEDMQRLPGIPQRSAAREVMEGRWPASTLVEGRNGETFLITANPQLDSEGRVLHIILNLRNITRLNHLKYRLERERGRASLESQSKAAADYVRARLDEAGIPDVVCVSEPFVELLMTAAEVAEYDSTVLLYGETGTGKGVIARVLHRLSRRADGPFVELNCGALPESLVESELFGYDAGAFTGALRAGKRGQFELAEGGTIFLDEVGELPLTSQAKLLKVMDDKVVARVGGTAPRKVDVRFICATNNDLRELVQRGLFREDLRYRLEVIPFVVPPLRKRPEDIKALAYAFLEQMNRQFGKRAVLALETIVALQHYAFPGNVRELRNLIERLVMTAKNEEIQVGDLPGDILASAPAPSEPEAAPPDEDTLPEQVDFRARVDALERRLLVHYARLSSSTYELAKRTGLHQSSVMRKLRKFGIRLKS